MTAFPPITKVRIDPDIAFLVTIQKGQTRLVSIIIAFMFWFFISVSLMSCQLLGLIHVDSLFLKLSTVLSLLGLSPLLLTTLTWKIFEKLCSLFLKSYKSHYLIK